MLDPTIAEALKPNSYANFANLVSSYRHDIMNKFGNVQLSHQVVLRLMQRLPDSFTLLSDTAQPALDVAEELLALSQKITDDLRDSLWFPEEDSVDETDEEMQARFVAVKDDRAPYNEQVWAELVTGLQQFLMPLIDEMQGLLADEEKALQALQEEAEDEDNVIKVVMVVISEAAEIPETFNLFRDFLDIDKLTYDPTRHYWNTVSSI